MVGTGQKANSMGITTVMGNLCVLAVIARLAHGKTPKTLNAKSVQGS